MKLWPFALVSSFVLFIMIQVALVTAVSKGFEGPDDPNYYKHGLEYGRVPQAHGWTLRCNAGPSISVGPFALQVRALDEKGAPLRGANLQVQAGRPATRRDDMQVEMRETAPGVYTGALSLSPGQWNLRIAVECRGLRFEQTRRLQAHTVAHVDVELRTARQ